MDRPGMWRQQVVGHINTRRSRHRGLGCWLTALPCPSNRHRLSCVRAEKKGCRIDRSTASAAQDSWTTPTTSSNFDPSTQRVPRTAAVAVRGRAAPHSPAPILRMPLSFIRWLQCGMAGGRCTAHATRDPTAATGRNGSGRAGPVPHDIELADIDVSRAQAVAAPPRRGPAAPQSVVLAEVRTGHPEGGVCRKVARTVRELKRKRQ
eukprot:gene9834-biopygen21268